MTIRKDNPMAKPADRPTLEEVRQWPATVGIPEAAKALGVSRSHLYDAIKEGHAPVKVERIGRAQRVITASLLRLLEADPAS